MTHAREMSAGNGNGAEPPSSVTKMPNDQGRATSQTGAPGRDRSHVNLARTTIRRGMARQFDRGRPRLDAGKAGHVGRAAMARGLAIGGLRASAPRVVAEQGQQATSEGVVDLHALDGALGVLDVVDVAHAFDRDGLTRSDDFGQ